MAPNAGDEPQEEKGKKKAKKKPRLLYIDNLKSVLTSIVILHHTTSAFSGTGWLYMIGAYRNPFSSVFAPALGHGGAVLIRACAARWLTN